MKMFYSVLQSLGQDAIKFPNAVIRDGSRKFRKRKTENILAKAQPRFINTIREHLMIGKWGFWHTPLKFPKISIISNFLKKI